MKIMKLKFKNWKVTTSSSDGEVAQVVARSSLKRVVIVTRLQNEDHEVENQKLKSHNEQLRWRGCWSCCEVLFKWIFNCVGQFTIVQLKWKSSSQVGILTCFRIEQRKLILDLLKILRLLTMAVTTYFWAGRLHRPISENDGTQL